MSDLLSVLRSQCGMAGDEAADLIESQAAALAAQAEAHAAELRERNREHNRIMADADEDIAARDTQIARLTAERDALRAAIDWLECCAMNGQIQIARSILRPGYEIALAEPKHIKIAVYTGTLLQALDAARAQGGTE